MYVLKSGDLYWSGQSFVPSQRDARRFPVDSIGITAAQLLFTEVVRFVKLRAATPSMPADSCDTGADVPGGGAA